MQKEEVRFNLSGVTYHSFGPCHELPLRGGLFGGVIVTRTPVPDGVVLKLSVQKDRVGNGPQKIQSAIYRIRGGEGVAL